MYAAKLRQRPEFRDTKRAETEYNKHRNTQLNFVRYCKTGLEQ